MGVAATKRRALLQQTEEADEGWGGRKPQGFERMEKEVVSLSAAFN